MLIKANNSDIRDANSKQAEGSFGIKVGNKFIKDINKADNGSFWHAFNNKIEKE